MKSISARKISHAYRQVKRRYDRYGISIIQVAFNRLVLRLRTALDNLCYPFFFNKEDLESLFSSRYEFVDYSAGKLEWNGRLVQRYRQIATEFSKLDGLVISGSLPQVDNVRFVRKISPHHILINPYIRPLVKDIEKLCSAQTKKVIVRLQSTDFTFSIEDVNRFKEMGFSILYEYIDPFHENISGDIPEKIYERHKRILQDEGIFVCCTADALKKEVSINRANVLLSPNGVYLEHWKSSDKPNKNSAFYKELKGRNSHNLPVIGYHGALAKWIDYDLLKKISKTGDYFLLIIGQQYDDSLKKSGLLSSQNVFYAGPVDYDFLPQAAQAYDISIIPFEQSELSNCVSPIKLFEYMALGKPIVSTETSEVLKYRSCLVSQTHDGFIKKLEYALQLKNELWYRKILNEEARCNSWNARAKQLLAFLKEEQFKV